MRHPDETRDLVREKYGALAEAGQSCCGSGSCGSGPALAELGYTESQAAAVPAGADLGLGCGNPLAYAAVHPGETVLDLGSGAGIDAFLAAREAGPTGRVVGVDMTPAMIERARRNAAEAGYTNVEFRLGQIEQLPLASGSVDVIISNCVINLSPEKEKVFAEAWRVLRPGGRMVVSDLVWLEPPSAEVRDSTEALVGCVAGASLLEEYLELIRTAGFREVEVVARSVYLPGEDCCAPNLAARVASVKVRAVKGHA